jgi:ferrous iron transport protein B
MRRTEAHAAAAVKKVLIVGLPNTGKSQVFNSLTGEYSVVANYPMTTVQAQAADIRFRDERYRIIDTPGLHCLYIHSEEELLIRDAILKERPDILLQCIDANRIKQSLFLTSDLAELGIPLVISLNAVRETESRGRVVSAELLADRLGVPVVQSVAAENRGSGGALRNALRNARVPADSLQYDLSLESEIEAVSAELPPGVPYQRKLAILLLQEDPYLRKYLRDANPESDFYRLMDLVARFRREYRGNVSRAVNNTKQRWVDEVEAAVVRHQRPARERVGEWFAATSRHPLLGLPLFAAFVGITYVMVVHVAGFIADAMNAFIVDPTVGLLYRIIPAGVFQDFLIGEYGIVTLGFFNAVATVLPVLSVFFVVFGFMEDIGYLPNLTVLVKRVFQKIGLSGKSVMPIILGFGCKTMATLTTKSISARKEKLIAIFLIAFAIPCSAQLGLNIAILGIAGFDAFLIAVAFLSLVEVAAGAVMNKILPDEERTSFIQELPPFRMPRAVALARKTYFRLVWFLKEAIPIFLIAAAALFVIDLVGFLDLFKGVIRPIVVGWLGLPLDMVDALLLTMARHEAAAGLILNMSQAGKLSFVQNIVAVVITTMFVPCLANMVAIFKEVGAKTAIPIILTINVSSFILAGSLHWLLRLFY